MLCAYCLSGILAFAVVTFLPSLPPLWLAQGSLLCLAIIAMAYLVVRFLRSRVVYPNQAISAYHHVLSISFFWRFFEISDFLFWRRFFCLVVSFLLAFSYALSLAHERLNDRLDLRHEVKVARTELRIRSIAVYTPDAIQFDAELIRSVPTGGIPSLIRVRWQIPEQEEFKRSTPRGEQDAPRANLNIIEQNSSEPANEKRPLVRPGQVWQMSLQLKRPRALVNPGGFDYETYLFREGIRVLGAVRRTPRLLHAYQADTLDTRIQALRHDIREAMQEYLQDKRYGAVIIALVMGDQSSISQEDWQLFNRTGITHLVSISGSHITMLAALATVLVMYLWPRLGWRGKSLGDSMSGIYWAGAVGVFVAFVYCLLAGWGVPAQRTFLMLALFYAMSKLSLPISTSGLFAVVALLVLYIDPWAILAPGFYLSFVAVAVLRHLMTQLVLGPSPPAQWSSPSTWRQKWQNKRCVLLYRLRLWWRVQVLITLVLAPFLLLFFNQISLVSPLVNAYAIFLVGAIITPSSLILAVLSLLSPWHYLNQLLADMTHSLLFYVMCLTEYVASFSWASISLSGVSAWVLLLSLLGVAFLVLPKGLPFKPLSYLLLVPAFLLQSTLLREGDWQMWALDIGQGSALVVRTAQHTLLFDTGLKTQARHDSATRVIIPSLRYLSGQALDALVVSHSDSDHSGGVASLLAQWPVRHAYASFRLDRFLAQQEKDWNQDFTPVLDNLGYQACQSGYSFEWDGVLFRFMYPEAIGTLPERAGNDRSCVLLIEGKHHSALLTGDILWEQEQAYDWPRVDVVVAAHHVSLSSSSPYFVEQTQAKQVIVQTGFFAKQIRKGMVSVYWTGIFITLTKITL